MIEFFTKKNRGFSLIELLVVGAIIALISTIFLIGFGEGEEHFALQRSTHMLAQDIRRIQELAMRAEDFHGFASRGGFGIQIESATSSYILFADCDMGGDFDDTGGALNCEAATTAPDGSVQELLAIRELEEGVTIISVTPNPLTIVFIPPDPGVRIRDNLGHLFATTTITLGINIDGVLITRSINVNDAGLIAIE